MKRVLPALLLMVCATAWAQTSLTKTTAASGPTQAWNVFTLPNEAVTPNWKSNKAYIPKDCRSRTDVCADDHRFWEEWDFTKDFATAIDKAFAAVASQGNYQSVMVLMPLTAAGHFQDNYRTIASSAAAHGVTLEPVLFPKWKYGAEWCYLYQYATDSNVQSNCTLEPGTNKTLAFEALVAVMDFTLSLGGCPDSSTTPGAGFTIWYGWASSEFPQQDTQANPGDILKNFWKSLGGVTGTTCNLQSAYITWLDTDYTDNPNHDVQKFQQWVQSQPGNKVQWVNTELYSDSQITNGASLYLPHQTVITGYWDAADITAWAQGMCSKWTTALNQPQFGVWTFYDRDVDRPYELYRSYINNQMADVGSFCTY